MKYQKYKLSILIPAFNVEKWLIRCLNSIFSQPTNDVEVILVDDGSTDETLQIANTYAKEKTNLIVLSQDNQGVAAARNRLIKEAHGDYIWFVDSDDFIMPDSIQEIFAFIERSPNIDMLILSYLQDDIKISPETPLFTGSGELFLLTYKFNGYLWTNIIKKKIITDNNISFDGKLHSQEDWLFLMKIFPHVTYLYETTIVGYHYRLDNSSSIMRANAKDCDRKRVDSSIRSLYDFKNYIEEFRGKEIYEAYSIYLNRKVIGLFYYLLQLKWAAVEVNKIIDLLKNRHIYPIGRTNIIKYDLFRIVVNRVYLYKVLTTLRSYSCIKF